MSSASDWPSNDSSALDVCACSPATVRALGTPLRRRLVCVLLDRSPLQWAELVDAVAAPTDDSHGMSVGLQHSHLPALTAARLATTERSARSVSLGSHPDLHDGPLSVPVLERVDQQVWTAVNVIHQDPWRGEVISFLAESGSTATLAALTRRVARSFERSDDDAVTTDTLGGPISSALHHVHLPKLSAVGLLDYDEDSGEVAYAGEEWFELSSLVETLSHACY